MLSPKHCRTSVPANEQVYVKKKSPFELTWKSPCDFVTLYCLRLSIQSTHFIVHFCPLFLLRSFIQLNTVDSNILVIFSIWLLSSGSCLRVNQMDIKPATQCLRSFDANQTPVTFSVILNRHNY